jgi:hypothetical protein
MSLQVGHIGIRKNRKSVDELFGGEFGLKAVHLLAEIKDVLVKD